MCLLRETDFCALLRVCLYPTVAKKSGVARKILRHSGHNFDMDLLGLSPGKIPNTVIQGNAVIVPSLFEVAPPSTLNFFRVVSLTF